MPGCEVLIAEDGEILLRGGNIFVGYLNDAARTRDALDALGWLHTGDVGVLDDYLKIVDRKKEIIITAGGKNVSPANLEAALKQIPLVGQACVVGDGRPYITALIVLDPEVTAAWATRHGVSYGSLLEMSEDLGVRAEIDAGVAKINREFSQPEQIKRFAILSEEWLADSDELTPTLKLKRRSVLEKFAPQISELYP
jgi:long-chain acyl-CoA synthetase